MITQGFRRQFALTMVLGACIGTQCTGPMGPGQAGEDDSSSVAGVALSSEEQPQQQQEPPLVCDAGEPYTAECEGASTAIALDGSGSSTTAAGPLTYEWTTDCPNATFDDATLENPTLTVDTSAGCAVSCSVSLTVNDGTNPQSSCDTTVEITEPPPPLVCDAGEPYTAECEGATTTIALDGSGSSTTAAGPITYGWTTDCPNATFDDATLENPTLTVDTSAGCAVSCSVSLTVNDGTNPESSCDTTVEISEPPPPVCDAGDPYTVECGGSSTVVPLDGSGSMTTTAGPLTYEWTTDCAGASFDDPTIAQPMLTLDTSAGCGTTCSVTLTVDDGITEPVSCETEVTVEDTSPPEFTVAPSDMTVECDGAGNTADLEAWLNSAVAADSCGEVTISHDFESLSDDCGETGSATVTWTATNACGLATTTSATFTIEDTSPPEFTVAPSDMTVECDGAGNTADLEAWLNSAVAADSCGEVTISHDFESLSDDCGETGSATVTWTATNACGLATTTSATFTIEDTQPPTITLVGEETVTVECHTGTYTEEGATAQDDCDTSPIEVTIGGDVVDIDTPGTYVVTYDAMDACGNAAAQAQRTVEVVDTTPPVITVKDMVEIWPPNHKYESFKLSDCVTAEDACEGSLDVDVMGRILSIYSDEPEESTGSGNTKDDIVITGHSAFELRAEREGGGNGRVYGVQFEITDASGNTSEGVCYLGVPHDQSGDEPIDDGPAAGYSVSPAE